MELKEARYIISIYKNKSITKAAEELYISQPSLSRYLQNMERRLGNVLFSRIGNEYVPTYFGMRYIDYASRILILGDEWEKEYCELINEKKGVLTIAIPLMRSSCILPQVLHRFYEKYPQVSVNLKEESHAISKRSFMTNDIDLAIYNPSSISASLDYISLGTEPFVLVTPKNHLLNKNGEFIPGEKVPYINLSLFKNEEFILHFPDQNSGKLALELFEKYSITPKTVLQTRSPEVAVSLTSLGTGVCFAPQSYVEKIKRSYDVSYFCVGEPVIRVELKAIYRKGEFLPSYSKYFIKLIKDVLSEYQ